jgi:two-component system, chemotaxis family, CheB/CheR fusion protein
MPPKKNTKRKSGGKKSTKAVVAPPTARNQSKDFPIVGIGASAGGYEAFLSFLKALRTDTGFAFVFVQHQDPTHESHLVELLARVSKIPVVNVTDRMRVEPNKVFVNPPNSDITIERGLFRLIPRRFDRVPHHPIDEFFQSQAEYRKRQSIGVILSGTASDGTLGLQAIKAEGGITFAQDEASAKFAGMPHNAALSHVVDFVLPPHQIAIEIGKLADNPLIHDDLVKPISETAQPADLLSILNLIRKSKGVDFSQYKPSTVLRRIQRRMLLHRMDSLKDYSLFLAENPKSLNLLYEDMLINVTQFFRDPDTFEALKLEVFPRMLPGSSNRVIRVWVPGCSSGEEAYSIAIAFQEFCAQKTRNMSIQIFGTDISEGSIEKARAGHYPFSIAANVSPERLQRYFVKTDSGYQIHKAIRDYCVFACHNVAKDPPFSRIDLLSCRNLLIYLGPALQKKVLPIFHYALNPNGYLMLGNSETIGAFGDYFFPADRKSRIFSRKSAARRSPLDMMEHSTDSKEVKDALAFRQAEVVSARDILREGDRMILSRYAPASVILDENFDILQSRGQTGSYLELGSGQASLNIMRMAREGLAGELRAALLQARKEKVPVQKEGLQVEVNGTTKTFDLEVSPYSLLRSSRTFFLVFFDDREPQKKPRARTAQGKSSVSKQSDEVIRLRSELTSTREYLQSIIEEQEATNEELRAANEEILSSNEELQSTNEEMDTAKEELQSANEELMTVNEEIQVRNMELVQINDDLRNLIGSVFIPIVILGSDLKIRRFTPPAHQTFNLIDSDVGRPITDIHLNIQVPNLYDLLMEVVDNGVIESIDVKDNSGHWYNLQIRPFKTGDYSIEGAVLALIDIDALKQTAPILLESQIAAIAESMHEPVVVLDQLLNIKFHNAEFQRTFSHRSKQLIGKPFFEFERGLWNAPKLKSAVEKSLKQTDSSYVSVSIEKTIGSFKRLNVRVRNLKTHNGASLVLISIETRQ